MAFRPDLHSGRVRALSSVVRAAQRELRTREVRNALAGGLVRILIALVYAGWVAGMTYAVLVW